MLLVAPEDLFLWRLRKRYHLQYDGHPSLPLVLAEVLPSSFLPGACKGATICNLVDAPSSGKGRYSLNRTLHRPPFTDLPPLPPVH